MREDISKLFEEEYVIRFFTQRILPSYPEFQKIKKVEITPIKKRIWKTRYHVVIKFDVRFVDKEGKSQKVLIYCSAHSHEPRRNVYSVLKFLWKNNFSRGYLVVPRPLFYSERFKGVFYRGVAGENLFHYIKQEEFEEAEKITAQAARWLAKLHKLPVTNAINFNKKNSRVKTIIPGEEHVLHRIDQLHPQHYDLYVRAYDYIKEKEKKFFSSTTIRWLIHGDAHPENVIRISRNKVAFIDYADLCLSDYTRDLGSFIQQLDYMVGVQAGHPEQAEQLKKIFWDNYWRLSRTYPDDKIRERVDMYYYWTALRTATHFLLKHNPRKERAEYLLEEIKKYLDEQNSKQK